MSYRKPVALEHIFNIKFNPDQPQFEIPFTREDVREAIIATGGQVPDNLNNFVKDLVRTGNPDARSATARENGYYLREGSHSGSMGVFFKHEGSSDPAIAVICPNDLIYKIVKTTLPSEIFDLVRPDEGGLVAVMEYCHLLDDFFDLPKETIKRVQSPVKIQPHELDSLFVFRDGERRVSLPCEAKSKGNDVLTLNQIVGIAAATLQRLYEEDMRCAIPIGAKIESNGDIFLVRFPECNVDDLLNLRSKLTAESVVAMKRYRLEPRPVKWL